MRILFEEDSQNTKLPARIEEGKNEVTLEFNELLTFTAATQKSGEIYFVLCEKQGDEFSMLDDMIATHDMPVKECLDQRKH